MTAPTLTEFLLARIGEDESGDDAQLVGSTRKDWSVRWAAECDAKREIVRYYIQLCANAEMVEDPFHYHSTGLLYAVRTHAAVYADHPDYDEAWRP